jgi:hypothetical protein
MLFRYPLNEQEIALKGETKGPGFVQGDDYSSEIVKESSLNK